MLKYKNCSDDLKSREQFDSIWLNFVLISIHGFNDLCELSEVQNCFRTQTLPFSILQKWFG